jgi:hypothetical protein
MVEYLERTDRDGNVPFYNPTIFEQTLEQGSLPLQNGGGRK